MRRLAATAAAAAGAAVMFTGATAATPTKLVTINLNDIVDVTGTRIGCVAQIGRTSLKGKKLVGCFVVDAKGPDLGSFAPALAADGEIVVVRLAKGTSPVVFRRSLSAAERAAKTVKLGVGNQFLVRGTDLACGIVRSAGAPLVSCFKLGADGPKPNTYGFAITDRLAAVVRFDAQGKARQIFSRNHP